MSRVAIQASIVAASSLAVTAVACYVEVSTTCIEILPAESAPNIAGVPCEAGNNTGGPFPPNTRCADKIRENPTVSFYKGAGSGQQGSRDVKIDTSCTLRYDEYECAQNLYGVWICRIKAANKGIDAWTSVPDVGSGGCTGSPAAPQPEA